MRISYYREVDALYIRFVETTVTTDEVAEGIAVDYAAGGRIAGIEILDAKKRFGDPASFGRLFWKILRLRISLLHRPVPTDLRPSLLEGH